MGSGKIGNQLKNNSLISGDLNQFKRINFDMPVIKLFNEYNNKNTTLERRNEIKFEIENRKKLMNYLTESPTEKGIVDSVEFRYQPNRLSASVIGVEDIDKVKNFNIEDYVQRGESYKEAFISKGKQLGLVEDGAKVMMINREMTCEETFKRIFAMEAYPEHPSVTYSKIRHSDLTKEEKVLLEEIIREEKT